MAGLGEIGKPMLKLISKSTLAIGFDIDSNLIEKKRFEKYQDLQTLFLHICIPFTSKFKSNIFLLYNKFQPECIVIHSTVSPNTTEQLQKKFSIPVIYSATRGIHERMFSDLKRYTKFFAINKSAPRSQWASSTFSKLMNKCGIKTKKMSNPRTLEFAKIICDTTYLGWLINYAQISNMIAIKHGVNYDEMWSFADEIHKNLGNRPKMYPGFIGGHCVIPNLDLMHNQTLNLIRKMNNTYAKNVRNSKEINKKYKTKLKRLKKS